LILVYRNGRSGEKKKQRGIKEFTHEDFKKKKGKCWDVVTVDGEWQAQGYAVALRPDDVTCPPVAMCILFLSSLCIVNTHF
jgi:hypothetical protein